MKVVFIRFLDYEYQILENAASNRTVNSWAKEALLNYATSGPEQTVTHAIGKPQPATVTVTDGPPMTVNAETGEVTPPQFDSCEICRRSMECRVQRGDDAEWHKICSPCYTKGNPKLLKIWIKMPKKPLYD